MTIAQRFIEELKHESIGTIAVLKALPEDRFGWRPHEKSYSLVQLANHIAEMGGWVPFTMDSAELDLAASDYKAELPTTTAQLVEKWEKGVAAAIESLGKYDDAAFAQIWTMRSGSHVIFSLPKEAVIRTSVLNHLYHHRGQLTVYLRLLNQRVPGVYGPTADDAK